MIKNSSHIDGISLEIFPFRASWVGAGSEPAPTWHAIIPINEINIIKIREYDPVGSLSHSWMAWTDGHNPYGQSIWYRNTGWTTMSIIKCFAPTAQSTHPSSTQSTQSVFVHINLWIRWW